MFAAYVKIMMWTPINSHHTVKLSCNKMHLRKTLVLLYIATILWVQIKVHSFTDTIHVDLAGMLIDLEPGWFGTGHFGLAGNQHLINNYK